MGWHSQIWTIHFWYMRKQESVPLLLYTVKCYNYYKKKNSSIVALATSEARTGWCDTVWHIQQESKACSLSIGTAPAQLDTHSLKIILYNCCSSTTKCSMRKIPPFPGMNSLWKTSLRLPFPCSSLWVGKIYKWEAP